jgi:6-phosphogluconolactonase (cycloisomerase 2 family)
MRARSISAFFAVIITAVLGAALLAGIGCASGHKQFLYVVGQGTNEVFEFRAQADGTLAPLGTPNFPAGSNPSSLTTHTSGAFLYVANFSGNNVTLLDINRSNGQLSTPVSNSVVTPVNPPNQFPANIGPVAIAMSPTQPFLFVANQTSGDINAYTVDPGVGGLGTVQGSPFPVFGSSAHPSAMAISPKGNFLFVADSGLNAIFSIAIGTNGALTAAPTSPIFIGGGATPVSLAVEHSGRFLYAADSTNNEVLAFSIQGDGSLKAISTSGFSFPAGLHPKAIAIDPQGALLFAANSGSNNVSAYVIDANNGSLGAVKGSPFATGGLGPSALVVDTSSSVLYVTDAATNDIAALGILADGSLKPVKGSPFSVATSGLGMTVVLR